MGQMEDEVNKYELGRGFHIAHLNVRSLLGGNKFDMLKHQVRTSSINIFTMSETWLTESIPDKVVEIEGYEIIRQDRAWRDRVNAENKDPKRGGGLACFIRKGIKYSDSSLKHLNVSSEDLEMMWIKVTLENVRPIVIVTAYRPPQGNSKRCCELIGDSFDRANMKDNTDMFLLGDFNIDFMDRLGPAYKDLDFVTRLLGLRQLMVTPTRISFRDGVIKESLIDLLFTNSDYISDSKTLNFNISDHLGIVATRKKSTIKPIKIDFKGRSYRNYDKVVFQEGLINAEWDPFYANDDPNLLWDYMYDTILGRIDVMCPIRSFKVAEFKEVWMTNEAIEAINDKDRALNRARRTGSEEDWEVARRLRNQVGRDIRNLRADFLKSQQEVNREDPKKFWKCVSSVLPGKRGSLGNIWLKEKDTGADIELESAAGYINEFFTNIGPNLAKNHKADWKYYGKTVPDSAENISTDLEEVEKLSKGIEVMKSSGLDKLSAKICKDAFVVLGQQLTYLFNCSLEKAVFPDKWKVAKVVPLFKGGNKEDVGNYRPVSLLPLPGKLLEKIVHKKITKFWDDNQFLSRDQGGFRKGFSTVATIADLTDDFFNQINQGNTTLAAFIERLSTWLTQIFLKESWKSRESETGLWTGVVVI